MWSSSFSIPFVSEDKEEGSENQCYSPGDLGELRLQPRKLKGVDPGRP